MPFQFDITLTDEDYVAYNCFHAFYSPQGKKNIKRSRIFFITVMSLMVLIGLTISITFAALLAIVTVVYMVFFQKIVERNIRKQIQRLKKTGKLPFEATTTLEFYEDKMIETTPTARTERTYEKLERICVLEGRYIFLYDSSVTAHIIPINQIGDLDKQAAFICFMSKKCSTVEYH